MINVCPGTLASGFNKYSPACIRRMFGGIQVSHVLDFKYDAEDKDFVDSVNRISISGAQEKLHSDTYARTGHPCRDDFATFGERIGVLPKKIDEIVGIFATEQPLVHELIEKSFLDEQTKRMYKRAYQERLHRFQRKDKS